MRVTIGHAHNLGVQGVSTPFEFDPATSGEYLLTFEFAAPQRLDKEWSWPLLMALHDIEAELHARVQLYVESRGGLVKRERTIWVDIYPGATPLHRGQPLVAVTDGSDGVLRLWTGGEWHRPKEWWDPLIRRELYGVLRQTQERLRGIETEHASAQRLATMLVPFAM